MWGPNARFHSSMFALASARGFHPFIALVYGNHFMSQLKDFCPYPCCQAWVSSMFPLFLKDALVIHLQIIYNYLISASGSENGSKAKLSRIIWKKSAVQALIYNSDVMKE